MKNNKSYYERNKYLCCKRRIGILLDRSFEKIRNIWAEKYNDKIEEYREKFPFDEKFYSYGKYILNFYGIRDNSMIYDECISFVYVSYDYSIHRATVNKCENIKNYIKKMIKIFFICIINTYDLTKEIAKYHNLILTDEEGNLYKNKEE